MAASGASDRADDFLLGERYFKSPEMVRKFIACLPITDIPTRYVVMKPLDDTDFSRDDVRSITFLVNPDQLSALVVLANYDGDDNENVIMPMAAGCQSIGICTFRENQRTRPRAVVGLVDLPPAGICGGNWARTSVVLGHGRDVPANGGQRRRQFPATPDVEKSHAVGAALRQGS